MVLLALSWRSFLVYTDNWGMIFVALVLYIYTLDIKPCVKMPLVFAAGAIGTFVKATVFICIIAVSIHAAGMWLISGGQRIKAKELAFLLACAALIFGGMFAVQNAARERCALSAADSYKSWQYFFMMGQNSENYGVVGGDEWAKWSAYMSESSSHAEAANKALKEGLNRIRARGWRWNFGFYMRKLTVAYNDGLFHNVGASGEDLSGWGSLYYYGGKYYRLLSGGCQLLWDGVLLLLALNAVRRKKLGTFTLFEIAILGVTLYLMIFENRSKYLFMFLPVYVAGAGIALHQLSEAYNIVATALVSAGNIKERIAAIE